MTSPITNLPAPSWLRELAHGRANYEELLGWPVSVQVGDRTLIVATGQTVDAVTMPAGLGMLVRRDLGIAMLCGPVMADPAGARWTFLTKPFDSLRPTTTSDLSHLDVEVVPHGGHVVIPTDPHVRTGSRWRWIDEPRSTRPLPPAYAVIAVTRRLNDLDHPLVA